MAKIQSVTARQLIDCKCRPMVEVDIVTDTGALGRGSAPTGSSVGVHESFVLRDNDPGEYDGMSVHRAVNNVKNHIGPALIGMDIDDLRAIDLRMIELDGSHDKHNLGGNAIYSTSTAALRAAAAAAGQTPYRYLCGRDIRTVPVPTFNVINGGRYGDVTMAFNEFLMVPYGAETIDEAVEMAVKCFQRLGDVLKKYLGKDPMVARSYGWAAPTDDPAVALMLMQDAIDQCGYHDRIVFALDCASSEMYDAKTNTYLLKKERVSGEQLIAYTKTLCEQFRFLFIEDLLDEDDWENYPKAVSTLTNTIILGDDLIASDPERLRRAYETRAVDGFILKPNQIGTLSEALDAHRYAQSHGMYSVPSGRSGGVVGDIVMDLAVGLEIPFIKNGAPRSGERIDKLNFLIRACDTAPNCKLSDLRPVRRF